MTGRFDLLFQLGSVPARTPVTTLRIVGSQGRSEALVIGDRGREVIRLECPLESGVRKFKSISANQKPSSTLFCGESKANPEVRFSDSIGYQRAQRFVVIRRSHTPFFGVRTSASRPSQGSINNCKPGKLGYSMRNSTGLQGFSGSTDISGDPE